MQTIRRRIPVSILLVTALCLSIQAQTYTANELVASAPLAWQSQYDPAGRMQIGNDDGNIYAASHEFVWASAIRFGGAQGLEGLLYDFTISAEGPPRAFGLAPQGCRVLDEASMFNCMRIRWEPAVINGQLIMNAVLSFKTNTVAHPVFNVMAGESFSIERVGAQTINFYRSTGIPGERQRVFSFASPYATSDSTVWLEPRTAFAPDSVARKVNNAQEIYYCCL